MKTDATNCCTTGPLKSNLDRTEVQMRILVVWTERVWVMQLILWSSQSTAQQRLKT